MNKLFVIGCSRSGTSFLQKKIVEEFCYWSLPETSFYLRNRNNIVTRFSKLIDVYLKSQGKSSQLVLNKFKAVFSPTGLRIILASSSQLSSSRMFDKIVSSFARANGQVGWLEKSPLHFRYIDSIKNDFEDAKIIYVIRNGRDVVASIVDRANKYPEIFSEQNVDYAINLWNESIEVANKIIGDESLLIISYEAYVGNEAKANCLIKKFLGSDFRELTGDKFSIVEGVEQWKSNLSTDSFVAEDKFSKLFSLSEQEIILSKLNCQLYNSILERIASDEV
ncbi:sulfotransferase [Vibrio cyclitrophicus]